MPVGRRGNHGRDARATKKNWVAHNELLYNSGGVARTGIFFPVVRNGFLILLREREENLFIFVWKRNKKAQLVFGDGVMRTTMARVDFWGGYKGWWVKAGRCAEAWGSRGDGG